jgi:hypothetical protein
VTLAELLREQTGGEIDLLANPRLVDIARYPLVVSLSRGTYVNFGDAVEQTALPLGIVQRLAERTGVDELRGLLLEPARAEGHGVSAAKLPILLRDLAWWDGIIAPFPHAAIADYHLPACGIVKLSAKTPQGDPVLLTTKAGHTDGHHSHTDIATFNYNISGESLLCDPGRGMYSKEYFRQPRYQNIFCNSIGHNVPRIAGALQSPGPEFGGHRQYKGQVTQAQLDQREKSVTIEYQGAYALPALTLARRRLTLDELDGSASLYDQFAFAGDALPVEEAFVTWNEVSLAGARAVIRGKHSSLVLSIQQPAGAVFELGSLEEECKTNQREGILKRLTVQLAPGQTVFTMHLKPGDLDHKK